MKNINSHSFYEWDFMDKRERDEKSSIISLLLSDYICLNDMFFDIDNEFPNKTPFLNAILERQGQFNSLSVVFFIGKIENFADQSILEDIAYTILVSTRTAKLTVAERAKLIMIAWIEAFKNFKARGIF
jgi:hypothetical protein